MPRPQQFNPILKVPSGSAPLVIPASRIAREAPGKLLAVVWRQWRAERRLARLGVRFRGADATKVGVAYATMSPTEFEAVNARQDWANWRTIPRALSGHVPNRPLRVVDLGCGNGSSTQVLAHYCPAGSSLLGCDAARSLLDTARARSYTHASGAPVAVDFVAQWIRPPLRGSRRAILVPGSIDLVNSSGILGHHFTPATVAPLCAEVRRVLRPDGVAMLDVGPTLTARALLGLMEGAGFVFLGHYRSWWGDPTGQMVFRRVT